MVVFSKSVPDSQYHNLRDIFMTALTAEQFNAVEFYVSSGYKKINNYLLETDVFEAVYTERSYQTIIQHLHTAIDTTPVVEAFPILYRGTLASHLSHYSVGDEFQFPFFVSASTDPVVALKFAGEEEPAVIVFTGVANKYALTSLNSRENEVLLSPTSRFTVENITQGVNFQAEYDTSGFYAPEKKNVTVIEMNVT